MLRRRTHARSTNGCLTCKKRHVRCDERRPYCRNCVRLGRECIFPAKTSPFIAVDPSSSDLIQHHAGETVTNWPRGYTIYYGAPHHRDISPTALSIMQQSQSFSNARPMPRSFWANITRNYAPNYNLMAAYNICVKHSLVSFAAYTHWQGSKSATAEDVCLKHYSSALRELQKEIENFNSMNADAIIVASIFLAGTAQDWDSWGVYIDGYSKVLSQVIASNYQTLFPELLTERFQLRRYFSTVNPATLDTHHQAEINMSDVRKQVASVAESVGRACSIVGRAKSKAVGFEVLETLARVVENSLLLSDSERYHKLSCLRTWMFWLDLRELRYGVEENALAAMFYTLLLAIVPIFPQRYRISLRFVCMDRIRTNVLVMKEDPVWEDEVTFLVTFMGEEN